MHCQPYGLIYQVTNKINGKVYIGQTVQTVAKRWTNHVSNSSKCLTYFGRAIQKHGKDAFSICTLGYAYSKAELNAMEIQAIRNHQSTDSRYGYNTAPGGEGFSSEDVKAHWADPVKREQHISAMKAIWSDPDYKARLVAERKNAYNTPESRARNRAAQMQPEVRAKKSSKRKEQCQDPAERLALRARAQSLWKDPEMREKQIAAYNKPEVSAKKAEANRRRWAVPGAKQAWVKKMQEIRAQKVALASNLRPAYETSRQDVADAISTTLINEIEKAAARQGKA